MEQTFNNDTADTNSVKIQHNNLDSLKSHYDSITYTIYKVRLNENLYTIAQKHAMSLAELVEINRLTSYSIRTGQLLKVRKKTEKPSVKKTATSVQKHPIYKPGYKLMKYRVKTGETIFSIAKQFEMTKEELMKVNNVATDSMLFILEHIKVKAKP